MALAKEAKEFIHNSYLPDVLEVAKYFKNYFYIGKGPDNFLSFNTLIKMDNSYMFSGGFSKNFHYEDKIEPYEIIEYSNYSYYKEKGG